MVEAAGGLAAERPRISPEFGVESKFSRHGGAVVPAALSSGGVYYVPFCVFMYVTSKKVARGAPLVSFEGCSADSHGRSSRADRLRPIRFVRRRWTCTRQTRACRSEAGWWVWPAGGRTGGRADVVVVVVVVVVATGGEPAAVAADGRGTVCGVARAVSLPIRRPHERSRTVRGPSLALRLTEWWIDGR